MSFVVAPQIRAAFSEHLQASYYSGLRCGVVRLLQLIAAVHLGATASDLAIIALFNGLGLMVSYLLGTNVDQKNIRAYLLIPSILSNFILISLVWVDAVLIFVVLVCLQSFLDTCTLPASGVLQKQIYPQAQRGAALGYVRARFMLCGLISAGLLAELLQVWDFAYKVALPLAGLLGIAATLHFWKMSLHLCNDEAAMAHTKVGEKQKKQTDKNQTTELAISNPFFLCFLGIVSFAEIAHLMLLPILPIYFLELGISARVMAWFFVIIPGLAGVLSFRYWGSFIDRVGVVKARGIGACIYAGEPLLLLSAPVLVTMSSLDISFWIIMAAVCRGVGLGAVVLTWSLAPLQFSRSKNCARYVGLNSLVTGLRGLLAPVLAIALYYNLGIEMLLLLSGIALFLSGTVLCFVSTFQLPSVLNGLERMGLLFRKLCFNRG